MFICKCKCVSMRKKKMFEERRGYFKGKCDYLRHACQICHNDNINTYNEMLYFNILNKRIVKN